MSVNVSEVINEGSGVLVKKKKNLVKSIDFTQLNKTLFSTIKAEIGLNADRNLKFMYTHTVPLCFIHCFTQFLISLPFSHPLLSIPSYQMTAVPAASVADVSG